MQNTAKRTVEIIGTKSWLTFPLALVFSGLSNIALYYLGLAFQENMARELGFALLNAAFACLCVIAGIWELRKKRVTFTVWSLLGIVLLFFGVNLSISLFANKYAVALNYVKRFGFFALPPFFAGIIGALNHKEEDFFDALERVAMFALPSVIIYLNGAVFNCNPFNLNLAAENTYIGRDLGILSYMTIAYTWMPLLLALIVQFLKEKPFKVLQGERRPFYASKIRLLLIFFYWSAIIATGTRGAYFCVIAFCIALVGFTFFYKSARIKTGMISLGLVAVLLFNLFIYAPTGYNTGRMMTFLSGLKEGNIVTSDSDDSEVIDKIDEIVGSEGNHHPDADDSETDDESEAPENQGSSDETEKDHPPIPQIKNRKTLYKLAIGEFKKNPIMGMGAGGFHEKYGTYPHNAILELLCETGICGTFILIGVLLLAIIRMFLFSRGDKNVGYVIAFLVAFAVQANISGSVWESPALMLALGYGLTLFGFRINASKEKDA